MEKDNAMEKAYKIANCPHCTDKMWFWQKMCQKCFLKLFEKFKLNL